MPAACSLEAPPFIPPDCVPGLSKDPFAPLVITEDLNGYLLILARLILRDAGAKPLMAYLKIRWNTRLRTTAGTAYYRKVEIALNPRLTAFGYDAIERTLRHEIAHIVAQYRAGNRRIPSHGTLWQRACRDVGIPNEKANHHLPLAPRVVQRRRHFYRCPTCGTTIARVHLLSRGAACGPCCKKYNANRYDARHRFEKIDPPASV